jgi:hypothetical protein
LVAHTSSKLCTRTDRSALIHNLAHVPVLVCSPRLSPGATASAIRPCSKPRASCCSPFDAQPLARVPAHASLPEAAQACSITFGMTELRARVFEHFCARGGARPCSLSTLVSTRLSRTCLVPGSGELSRTSFDVHVRTHYTQGLRAPDLSIGARSLRHATIAACVRVSRRTKPALSPCGRSGAFPGLSTRS